MNNINEFNKVFNKNLGWLRTNNYVVTVLVLFLVSYVAFARPHIPSYLEQFLMHPIVRFIIISYILYTSTNNIQTSVLLTFGFLLVMQLLNKQKIEKMNASLEINKDPYLINEHVNSPYCNMNNSNYTNPQCQLKLRSDNQQDPKYCNTDNEDNNNPQCNGNNI